MLLKAMIEQQEPLNTSKAEMLAALTREVVEYNGPLWVAGLGREGRKMIDWVTLNNHPNVQLVEIYENQNTGIVDQLRIYCHETDIGIPTIILGTSEAVKSPSFHDIKASGPVTSNLLPLRLGTVDLASVPGWNLLNGQRLFYLVRGTSFILENVHNREVRGLPVAIAHYQDEITRWENRWFKLVSPVDSNMPLAPDCPGGSVSRLQVTNCDRYMERHAARLGWVFLDQRKSPGAIITRNGYALGG